MQCKLYPYIKRTVATIQEIKQMIGWHITAFNIPSTWIYTQGEGVTVGVIDSGCDLNHPDLVENILEGYNVLNPSQKPEDDQDHGTHICGSICATHNKQGVVGIAPKVKVIPIKVLDSNGIGYMEDVAKGIRYGIERGVDMMCLALGSAKPIGTLRKAIKAATEKGIPLFCAAGNMKKDMDALYPARYPETIAIAALDKTFKRADFSNTGKYNIDFLAPGVDILSTTRGGWYAVLSGSSMAVPFAAGVAALLLSAKRQHHLKIDLNTVDDYRRVFCDHATDLLKYDGDKMFAGHGIIQPEKLLSWIKSQEIIDTKMDY